MVEISQYKSHKHENHVKNLFLEYLKWVISMLKSEYDLNYSVEDIKGIVDSDMVELGRFFPPEGRLLLAQDDDVLSGCICLKKIDQEIGEIKRMYVKPQLRGKGIGRSLLEAAINEARLIGYSKIRLDSARFMCEAHGLYYSAGFEEIEPYEESEIQGDLIPYWIFMEKDLVIPGN